MMIYQLRRRSRNPSIHIACITTTNSILYHSVPDHPPVVYRLLPIKQESQPPNQPNDQPISPLLLRPTTQPVVPLQRALHSRPCLSLHPVTGPTHPCVMMETNITKHTQHVLLSTRVKIVERKISISSES